MHLARSEDIAILLMSELTRNFRRRRVPLSEVAHAHGVSLLFLKKIARTLRQAGLIESKEGAGGGYSLAKSPRELSVWEVIAAFDDKQSTMPAALSRRRSCPLTGACLPQAVRRTVQTAIAKSLTQVTLGDLVTDKFYETKTV